MLLLFSQNEATNSSDEACMKKISKQDQAQTSEFYFPLSYQDREML